eukprot:403355944
MGQSDSKQIFQGGNIQINLNKFNWVSGEQLQGVVILSLREVFTSDKIALRFRGTERCYFDSVDRGILGGKGEIKAKNVIYEKEIVLSQFGSQQLVPGTYSYPFSIDLQSWFPSSFLYCGIQRCNLMVKYQLIAGLEDLSRQFRPLYTKKIVDISQPPIQADDMVNIQLDIDNSHCNQAISRVKAILKREVLAYGNNGKAVYRHEEKLGKYTHHGMGERIQQTLNLSFRINDVSKINSSTENYVKLTYNLPEEMKSIAQKLPPSINTILIKCMYRLEVHLDHGIMSIANRMPPIVFPITIAPLSLPKGFFNVLAPPAVHMMSEQNPYVSLQHEPYHSNVIQQQPGFIESGFGQQNLQNPNVAYQYQPGRVDQNIHQQHNVQSELGLSQPQSQMSSSSNIGQQFSPPRMSSDQKLHSTEDKSYQYSYNYNQFGEKNQEGSAIQHQFASHFQPIHNPETIGQQQIGQSKIVSSDKVIGQMEAPSQYQKLYQEQYPTVPNYGIQQQQYQK